MVAIKEQMHWPWTQDLKDIFMGLLVSSARDQPKSPDGNSVSSGPTGGVVWLVGTLPQEVTGNDAKSAPLLLTMILTERHFWVKYIRLQGNLSQGVNFIVIMHRDAKVFIGPKAPVKINVSHLSVVSSEIHHYFKRHKDKWCLSCLLLDFTADVLLASEKRGTLLRF